MNYATGEITFTPAPGAGVVITADYQQDIDYTIDYTYGEITFTIAPGAGVVITADYLQGAYVAVSYSKGFGEPGYDTGPPDFSKALCRIDFTVDASGESVLDLHHTELSHADSSIIYHEVVDGYFAAAAIPEFPLGMAMELALVVAVVYVWWKRKAKIKVSKFTTQ